MIRDTGWGTDFVEPLLNPLVEGSKVNEAPPAPTILSLNERGFYQVIFYAFLNEAL